MKHHPDNPYPHGTALAAQWEFHRARQRLMAEVRRAIRQYSAQLRR